MSTTLFDIDVAYHYTRSHALISELSGIKHDLGALLAPNKPGKCVVVKQARKMAQMRHQIPVVSVHKRKRAKTNPEPSLLQNLDL